MQIAFHTDSGIKRQENQDYVGAFTNQVNRVMVMVADGVTSTEGGDVASAMAVEHFGHAWEQTTCNSMLAISTWLKETAVYVNDVILAASQRYEDLNRMATTLVLAVIFDDQIIIGNLGDSKAFLLHKNRLKQISFDHNLRNELLRAGTITKKAAEEMPNGDSVTRFLGVDDQTNIEIDQHPFLQKDMLFLTSDGITKVLSNTNIKRIMQEKISLDLRAKKLIASANQQGAPDNVTALLVSRDDEKDTN